MFKSKTPFVLAALALSVSGVLHADTPEPEAVAATSPVTDIAPAVELSPAFNFVTINELMEIDEQRALVEERNKIMSLGLKLADQAQESGASPMQVEMTDGQLKELERLRKEMAELKKEQIKDKQIIEKIEVAEREQRANARLIGIFGVGSTLSAMLEYGGERYHFISSSKHNQRANRGNEVTLRAIKARCVVAFDEIEQVEINACIGQGAKREGQEL